MAHCSTMVMAIFIGLAMVPTLTWAIPVVNELKEVTQIKFSNNKIK